MTTLPPMRLFLLTLLTAIVLLYLSGCSTLSAALAPSAQPFEQAAVDVAVAAAVGTNPVTQPARAAKIGSIAQQLLAIDNGASVPLTALEAVVNQQIAALKLPPADVAAAQVLTAAITAGIQAQIAVSTKGAIAPTTQVAVATVLNWVITATKSYPATLSG